MMGLDSVQMGYSLVIAVLWDNQSDQKKGRVSNGRRRNIKTNSKLSQMKETSYLLSKDLLKNE